jgi:hypothetical protein
MSPFVMLYYEIALSIYSNFAYIFRLTARQSRAGEDGKRRVRSRSNTRNDSKFDRYPEASNPRSEDFGYAERFTRRC